MQQHEVAGWFAEDAVPGYTRSIGAYPVTEADAVDFATQWDPQTFHTDSVVADAGIFGGLIASGIHTLAIYQRLEVTSRTDDWQVIAGRDIEKLRFLRPVRPGDVLTGTSTIVDRQLEPDRRRGLITFAGELTNQSEETVLTLTMSAYLHMRSA